MRQAGLTMRVLNLDEVTRWLEQHGERYAERAFQGVRRACIRVQREARLRCPVRTGRLRRSITYAVASPLGMRGRTVIGRVGSNVEYAPFVELGQRRRANYGLTRGTRLRGRRAFLLPALEAERGRCIEDIRRALRATSAEEIS